MRRRVGSVVVVLVTCPKTAVARRLGVALVKRRLAACVNLIRGIESIFWWEGKIDRAREALLLIKTTRASFPRLRRAIRELHPYDVPEIIALPLVDGHPPYLRWVISSLSPQ
ncbi:MAG: divalent-cation tolerance protein CutA [Candidatus Omnitrophica bacterium]|nr:divalent-cation tolerance protein CutA [Candidatus Omnitrophota bacterium]